MPQAVPDVAPITWKKLIMATAVSVVIGTTSTSIVRVLGHTKNTYDCMNFYCGRN